MLSRWSWLRRSRTLKGPISALAELARAVEAGDVSIAPVDAVIPYTGDGLGALTERDRDLFWKVFQAPVFEQLRGPGNRVIAMECEAHNGLHVLAKKFPMAPLDLSACPCGKPGPRIYRIQKAGLKS